MPNYAYEINIRSVGYLTCLLRQPIEVISAVLDWLDNKDLLNLRISSKCLHVLIHELAKSLYTAYSGRLRQRYGPLVQLRIQVHEPDLMSYIELQDRDLCVWRLAGVLSDHLASKLRTPNPVDKLVDAMLRTRKASMLRKKLFPFLFTLNNFLERLSRAVAEADEAFAEWDTETYVAAYDVLLLDQQRLVESLCDDAATILGVSAAHSILLGTCNAKGLGPKIRAPIYPFASIKRLMLVQGLMPFPDLLTENHPAIRLSKFGKASEALVKVYQPKQHTYQLQSIHHLDAARYYLRAPSCSRPTRVIEQFLDRQDVWQKAAFAVLQRDVDAGLDQESNNIDAWIMSALAESDYPVIGLANWRTP